MPTYEYECPKCGRFEVEQRMSDKALTTCPECDKHKRKSTVERVISASSFQLKGGGWYKDGYAGGSGGSTKKASTSSDSTSTSSSSDSSSGSDKASSSSDKKGSGGTGSGGCGSGCGCH